MVKRSCEKSVRHENLNLLRTTLTGSCRVHYFKLDKFSPHICFIFNNNVAFPYVVSFRDLWIKYYEIHTSYMPSQNHKPWCNHPKIFGRERFVRRKVLRYSTQFISPYSMLVLLFLTTMLSDTLNIFCSEESDISFTSILAKVQIYIRSSVYFNSYGFRQERSIELSAGKIYC